jgi:hypothetical protein
VEIDDAGKTIRVVRGSAAVTVDGRNVSLGAAVRGKGTRLFVPVSFLSDVLGENVQHDTVNGIWFVTRDYGNISQNLVSWTLGMCAVLAKAGDGDPYYFGYYDRCMRTQENRVPSPYDPSRTMAVYSYRPAYFISRAVLANSWDCTSGDDIRQQANLLTTYTDETHPAWDLFRVAHIASWGYSGGYLTAEEALALVRPAAEKLQACYSGWDEATADYLDGYLAWSGDTEAYENRKAAYEQIKAGQANYGVLFDDALFTAPVG